MTRSFRSPPDTLLRALATAPRPTGSAALAAARDRCAGELRSLGFEVREAPFAFSAFPGRFATPLFGGAAVFLVGLAGMYGSGGFRWPPVLILALGGLGAWLVGTWLSKHGVLTAPLLREEGVNLEASRPGETPALWLCAHLDSKSQPVPTLARSSGIVLEGAGFAMMLVVATIAAAGGDPAAMYWVCAGFLTLLGGIPVMLSMVGTRSPGALDNASGVVTMLAVAQELVAVPRVGVLITDAEELGMAGARAWVRGGKWGGATVLNCDGVDDEGRIAVMFTGARPRALLGAVSRASSATGVPHVAMRMVPGVLTDSVAFADAGLPSVTFMRGSVRSLLRVHRAGDDLAHLRGTGIADTALLIAATVRALTNRETG
ncbi:MAG: M28 family peptidase [Gemmatimonadaceae bacterium]